MTDFPSNALWAPTGRVKRGDALVHLHAKKTGYGSVSTPRAADLALNPKNKAR